MSQSSGKKSNILRMSSFIAAIAGAFFGFLLPGSTS